MIKKIAYTLGALSLAGLWWYAHNHRAIPKASQPSNTLLLPAAKPGSAMTINVKEIITPSGIKVWFAPNQTLDVVSVGVCFRGGGERSTSKTEKGLTELLASTLSEGYGPFSSRQFKEMLQEKNIHLRAQGGLDNFTLTLRTTKDKAEDAFKVLQGMITSPRFDQEDVERIKKEIITSLAQSLHMPQTLAREALQTQIYGQDHPYIRNVNDRLAITPSITPEQLKNHCQKIFTQSNALVAVSGHIEESALIAWVEALFKDLPKGDHAKPEARELQNMGTHTHVNMPVPQTVVLFAQPGIDRKDKDFFAWHVAEHILGGNTFCSRLWHAIRESRGLAYSISTDLFLNDLSYGLMGATSTKTESANETLRILKEEWAKFAQQGVTQSEFEEAVDNITGAFPLSFTSTLDIVGVLLGFMASDLPITYINERNRYFTDLTLEDINRVIKRLIDPTKLTIVTVGQTATQGAA